MTFTPTTAADRPAVCFCCGAEATGIGLGAASRSSPDPRWLCEECVAVGGPLYTAARRNLSPYEKAAVARAVDAVGGFLEEHGTDLAEWQADTAEQFVGAIWQACGRELRAVIQEGVGPW
ncbi:DUF6511 domain-containing protein [Devosia elaeis]|uniref:Uncharacterized protein n=1 Tax=Devosia elaeis TaxID=1770058 RepID=A0A178HZ23_9HYPH|nr:DUF6511 domain-containing protein [Devosia elaeis]OAM77720.1 hypothetical protein A3840_08825 [Devosia elaeis]